MPTKKKFQEFPQTEAKQHVDWVPTVEHREEIIDLRAALEKIKDKEGIIGYIVRASTSACVDLKDPSKIIDYAVLSAAAMESGESLSNAFELGKISSIILEGKEVKILSLTIGEQRLSIFMNKNVDHNSVHKDLAQNI